MDRKELVTLLKGAFSNDPSVNFADREEAARKGLQEFFGEDVSYKEMLRDPAFFTVLEQSLAEVLPEMVKNVFGNFTQVLTFGRNEEVIYKVEKLGRRRALMAVVPGARAGVYRARRLDNKNLSINTEVITAGAFVHLEDILLGSSSLSELMGIIMDGVEYQIYMKIVAAMRTIGAKAPAANKATVNGFSGDAMDSIIRVVSAYGSPTIFCFDSFAKKITNIQAATGIYPNVSVADIEDIRQHGYVGLYKGTPVVKLPNYLVDETNSQWIFDESQAFVLPAAVKPVIIAFQGSGYIEDVKHVLGGAEMNFHQMLGVAVLTYNNLGIYKDSDLANSSNWTVTGTTIPKNGTDSFSW